MNTDELISFADTNILESMHCLVVDQRYTPLLMTSIAYSLLAIAINLGKLVDMKEMEQELETLE